MMCMCRCHDDNDGEHARTTVATWCQHEEVVEVQATMTLGALDEGEHKPQHQRLRAKDSPKPSKTLCEVIAIKL